MKFRTKHIKIVAAAVSYVTLLLLFAEGCGPSTESTKTVETTPVPLTKEGLYRRGHQLYLQQDLDSARILLDRALRFDATYKDAIADLASLHYDLAMRADGYKKSELLRKSREYYIKLESAGEMRPDTYERICEISNDLNDDKMFLKYAKKNVELYPYDRQYYNLSVAYFNVNDFTGLIKAMKEAVDRFKASPYIGSFYRQLGRGYMKVDRDQTAERTFYTGLNVVDNRMADFRKSDSEYKSSPDYARLREDKIGMLISLKNLHTTYKAMDKLADVEKKLKEMGR